MYEIIFYKDKNGYSAVIDYLDMLTEKSNTDKNARVNKIKILAHMQVLSEHGTRIGAPIVKHICSDLWELRSLSNRIFFFYWKDDKYVILHHYIKKSRKTPRKEIRTALNNMRDFIERNGAR